MADLPSEPSTRKGMLPGYGQMAAAEVNPEDPQARADLGDATIKGMHDNWEAHKAEAISNANH